MEKLHEHGVIPLILYLVLAKDGRVDLMPTLKAISSFQRVGTCPLVQLPSCLSRLDAFRKLA